jgi:hypothetical protein
MRCCINQIAAHRRTKLRRNSFYCFNFLTQRENQASVNLIYNSSCRSAKYNFLPSFLILTYDYFLSRCTAFRCVRVAAPGFLPSCRYSTFGNCGHRAPHGSFILPARFFAQSAVISSSQSTSLASRPRRLIRRFNRNSHHVRTCRKLRATDRACRSDQRRSSRHRGALPSSLASAGTFFHFKRKHFTTLERSFHARDFAWFVGGECYCYRHACCFRFRTSYC